VAQAKTNKNSTAGSHTPGELGRDISYDIWKRGMAAPDGEPQPRETRSIFRFG